GPDRERARELARILLKVIKLSDSPEARRQLLRNLEELAEKYKDPEVRRILEEAERYIK
uniref:PD-L1 de novo binder n=1 Tax=Escherichia coli TaxID=562 RepID=UPI003D81C650